MANISKPSTNDMSIAWTEHLDSFRSTYDFLSMKPSHSNKPKTFPQIKRSTYPLLTPDGILANAPLPVMVFRQTIALPLPHNQAIYPPVSLPLALEHIVEEDRQAYEYDFDSDSDSDDADYDCDCDTSSVSSSDTSEVPALHEVEEVVHPAPRVAFNIREPKLRERILNSRRIAPIPAPLDLSVAITRAPLSPVIASPLSPASTYGTPLTSPTAAFATPSAMPWPSMDSFASTVPRGTAGQPSWHGKEWETPPTSAEILEEGGKENCFGRDARLEG